MIAQRIVTALFARRRSIAVVVVVIAFGYWGLLSDSTASRSVWLFDDLEVATAMREYNARADTLLALTNRAEQMHAADALARLPRSRETFAIVAAPGIQAETRESFARPIRAAIDSLDGPPRHPLRVILSTDSMSGRNYRRLVLLPRNADEPCAVVITLSADRRAPTAHPIAEEPLLGACGFYARFGMPGRGMQDWLTSTRGLMAKVDQPRARRARSPVVIRGYFIAFAPQTVRCAADVDEACRDLWDGPGAFQPWVSPRIWLDTAIAPEVRHIVRGSRDDHVAAPGRRLGDLRSTLGDARFAEVWRSELPPAAAYEALTGASIGSLAREALLAEVEPYRPGPLHADLPTALSGVLILTSAALVIRFAARRRSE